MTIDKEKLFLSVILSVLAALLLGLMVIFGVFITTGNTWIDTITSTIIPLFLAYVLFPSFFFLKVTGEKFSYIFRYFRYKSFLFLLLLFALMLPLVCIKGSVNLSESFQILTIFFAVATAEEFLYRRVIQDLLFMAHLKLLAVLTIQAILFAFVNHSAENMLLNLLLRLPLGIILGWIAWKRKSIDIGIGVHFIYDVLVSLLQVEGV